MVDKEKVRKGFERCLSGRMPYGCGECPYFGDLAYNDAWSCRLSLMRDAFDIIKKQEEKIKNRDESLEKARKEIKWLRGMLKEQEPILLKNQHKPYGFSTNVNSPWISRCPKCGRKVEGKQTRFCKYCGQPVKWGA